MWLNHDEQLREIEYLREHVVDEEEQLKLLPARFYAQQPPGRVALWGNMLGVWLFPTEELVSWLKRHVIRGRAAIEVGAGLGDLGRFLGIPATDSYRAKEDPEVVRRLLAARQTPPQIDPRHTERMDAGAAVAAYRPEVVIAAWSVQKLAAELRDTAAEGMPWGIDECALVEEADYCLIGHAKAHRGKRVFFLRYTEYNLPSVISRAPSRDGNRIWWFTRQPRAGLLVG